GLEGSLGLALFVGWIAFIGAEGLVGTADLVRFAPFVTWRVAPPAIGVSAAYYVGVIAAWILWRRRARITGSGESSAACSARRGATLMAVTLALWIVAEPWTVVRARGDGRLHV